MADVVKAEWWQDGKRCRVVVAEAVIDIGCYADAAPALVDTRRIVPGQVLNTAKESILVIVAEHREHCAHDCAISLSPIRHLLTVAGLTLTADEDRLFI